MCVEDFMISDSEDVNNAENLIFLMWTVTSKLGAN